MGANAPYAEPQQRLYTQEEAADLLRVSKRTIEQMRADGRLGYVRVSYRRVFITQEQIDAYLAEHTTTGEAK